MSYFSAQDQKMAQTASNEVFFPLEKDYGAWKNEVSHYIRSKKEFQGEAPKYVKVTNK